MAEDETAAPGDIGYQPFAPLPVGAPENTPAADRAWKQQEVRSREVRAVERERLAYARQLWELEQRLNHEAAQYEHQLSQAIVLTDNPYAPQVAGPSLQPLVLPAGIAAPLQQRADAQQKLGVGQRPGRGAFRGPMPLSPPRMV